jgi:hypothetical protein
MPPGSSLVRPSFLSKGPYRHRDKADGEDQDREDPESRLCSFRDHDGEREYRDNGICQPVVMSMNPGKLMKASVVPGMKKSGRCHAAQTTPSTTRGRSTGMSKPLQSLAELRSHLRFPWYAQREEQNEGFMEMTAERLLHFHALSRRHDLPYCVVGGMAGIRNGLLRTTGNVDPLTFKKDWRKILPLVGEISSEGPDTCVDKKTGIPIDILFADEDWEMVMEMPDPRKVGEYDEKMGASFIGLHDLVQLKMAVYLSKLKEHGPATAAKDLGDVQGLMKKNLSKFSKEIVADYHPGIRNQCTGAFEEVTRAESSRKRERRDIER